MLEAATAEWVEPGRGDAGAGWEAPSLDQYYRALDAVADAKEATETRAVRRGCTDLTNLDLRLVCYDLTSTYFEGSTAARRTGSRPGRSATPVTTARTGRRS